MRATILRGSRLASRLLAWKEKLRSHPSITAFCETPPAPPSASSATRTLAQPWSRTRYSDPQVLPGREGASNPPFGPPRRSWRLANSPLHRQGGVIRFKPAIRRYWTATPEIRFSECRVPRITDHFCLRTVISKNLCGGVLPTVTSPVSTQSPVSFSFIANAIWAGPAL